MTRDELIAFAQRIKFRIDRFGIASRPISDHDRQRFEMLKDKQDGRGYQSKIRGSQ
jgi:hypothetical protein